MRRKGPMPSNFILQPINRVYLNFQLNSEQLL